MKPPQSQSKVTHCNLLKFQCDQQWEALTKTGDSSVRFCEQCKEAVFLCSSETEFREHAAHQRCVALAPLSGPPVAASLEPAPPRPRPAFVGMPEEDPDVVRQRAEEIERERSQRHSRAQIITWSIALALSIVPAARVYDTSAELSSAVMVLAVSTFMIATVPALIISRVYQKPKQRYFLH